MPDIFDLETPMMDCWSVCEALETTIKQIIEGESNPTPDELVVALMGIKQLYHWKFEHLFSTFEEVLTERNTNA
tara:strand:- start:24 stop:245 length:222 start_codon:yes stop_codon:yes gene_type:complete